MAQPQVGDLDRTLVELAGGRPLRQADLDGLAALDRNAEATLRQRWTALPDPIRMTIAAYIDQRSKEAVDEDYGATAAVALGDPLAVVRRFAVEALWETTDRLVGQRLVELVRNDSDDAVRASAARVLAGFILEREFGHGDLAWGDSVVEALRELVNQPSLSLEVRSSALTALAPRTDPGVQTAIREAYYSEDRDYRLAGVVAMGLTAQPQWLEYLYEQLASEDPDFRKAAATACGEMADEDAVDPLGDLLDDEDPLVVVAAVAALAEIGGETATEYLEEFRRRVPEELAESLEEAITIAREAEAGDGREDAEDDW